MTDTAGGFDPTPGDSAEHPHTLEVIDDDGDEYTFVPRGADADERRTQWLTADADAVIDLRAWR
ncbi:uncharacterized protein Nmlp_3796 [Natronomonas moolapensis 8.8.11]|uniref:DUF7511 domain-containing protein n=1 Tax=Natronomonas moolapensis (strain DSM 18674 / CECT 7526 / JCM 14361 / 8.8.11) TaxID=268739 RepID=M1XTT8_NATM8|nr:hypothetical protein [Natronomonas moolapensis]CCQ37909.1 uncharacterized protein Nmlp_3796 [Natronomonas moolapensis 8.8.11]